jgi:hypothetical protein
LPRLAAEGIAAGPGLIEPIAQPAIAADTVLSVAPAQLAAQVGNPEERHVSHARGLRRELRDALAAARSSWTEARAAVLGMLLSHEEPIRQSQLALLATTYGEQVRGRIAQLAQELAHLSPMLRLPAMQLLFATLRGAPQREREQLVQVVDAVAGADGRTDVFEFCLGNLLAAELRSQLRGRSRTGGRTLVGCQVQLGELFSVLAHSGAATPVVAQQAYEAGMSRLLPRDRPGMSIADDWPVRIAAALEALSELHPLAKELLVEALVVTISHDSRLAVAEAELLRTVCARLQCPLPPVLPGSGVGDIASTDRR